MKNSSKFFARAAITAALYVVFTFVANMFGLANGAVQVRISEALTVLPIFLPEAVWGLTLGCLLSNLLTGALLPDVIFGTLATFLGAIGTYYLGKKHVTFAIASPIVANTVIIPFVLYYAYGVKPLWFSVLTVGAGEVISCGVLGFVLYAWLKKNKRVLL